jgi:hypothetical protein
VKTITVGEECFGVDYFVLSAFHFGEERHSQIKEVEEKRAKRHLYEMAAGVFKNIHAAFLDKHDITLPHDREVGRLTFRMEYRVRGEVW